MNQTSSRHNMFYLNGWLAAAMLAAAAVLIAMALFSTVGVLAAPLFVFIVLAASGFRIVQPNTALVSTCFGRYSGILSESGFFWIIPLIYQTQSVSLRSGNYVTPTLKVNDAAGTPIEIAAAIVYHISNPAAAEDTESLTRHSEHILEQFRDMVQERVERAGISIDEARFTHLAYAPEIAQAMLRKQQAEAVIAARYALVRGAIGMVEGTVRQLEQRDIVKMSDSEKAKLVTNMMTVLLSEENAAPVLNVSGD